MHAEIKGATIPTVEIWLAEGEYVVTLRGELAWMTTSVSLAPFVVTETGQPGRRRRPAKAGGLRLTRYQGPGSVTFAAREPGVIYPLQVAAGRAYLVPSEGWICGTSGVQASPGPYLGSGREPSAPPGDRAQLLKLEGEGQAWVGFGGDVTSYELPPGQAILAGPGHLGMCEAAVRIAVTATPAHGRPGAGAPRLLELTGPGQIWLRSLPIPELAHQPQPFTIAPETGAGNRAAARRRAGG